MLKSLLCIPVSMVAELKSKPEEEVDRTLTTSDLYASPATARQSDFSQHSKLTTKWTSFPDLPGLDVREERRKISQHSLQDEVRSRSSSALALGNSAQDKVPCLPKDSGISENSIDVRVREDIVRDDISDDDTRSGSSDTGSSISNQSGTVNLSTITRAINAASLNAPSKKLAKIIMRMSQMAGDVNRHPSRERREIELEACRVSTDSSDNEASSQAKQNSLLAGNNSTAQVNKSSKANQSDSSDSKPKTTMRKPADGKAVRSSLPRTAQEVKHRQRTSLPVPVGDSNRKSQSGLPRAASAGSLSGRESLKQTPARKGSDLNSSDKTFKQPGQPLRKQSLGKTVSTGSLSSSIRNSKPISGLKKDGRSEPSKDKPSSIIKKSEVENVQPKMPPVPKDNQLEPTVRSVKRSSISNETVPEVGDVSTKPRAADSVDSETRSSVTRIQDRIPGSIVPKQRDAGYQSQLADKDLDSWKSPRPSSVFARSHHGVSSGLQLVSIPQSQGSIPCTTGDSVTPKASDDGTAADGSRERQQNASTATPDSAQGQGLRGSGLQSQSQDIISPALSDKLNLDELVGNQTPDYEVMRLRQEQLQKYLSQLAQQCNIPSNLSDLQDTTITTGPLSETTIAATPRTTNVAPMEAIPEETTTTSEAQDTTLVSARANFPQGRLSGFVAQPWESLPGIPSNQSTPYHVASSLPFMALHPERLSAESEASFLMHHQAQTVPARYIHNGKWKKT